MAGVLSGLLPGLGQFYNRQWGKGLGFVVVFFLLALILAGSYDPQEVRRAALMEKASKTLDVFMSVAMLLLGLVVWSVFDAFRTAQGPRSRMYGY